MLNRAATFLQIWLTTTVLDALRGGPPGARAEELPHRDRRVRPGGRARLGHDHHDDRDRGDRLARRVPGRRVNAVTNAFNSISGKS